MNFQDELKSAFKTKDEVYEEIKLKEKQEDLSNVKACAYGIERELLQEASNGEYELTNGEKIIKCKYLVLEDSYYLSTKNIRGTVQVQFNDRYKFFIDNLKNCLSKDNIDITREYLVQKNFKFKFPLWNDLGYPAVYQGYNQLSYSLAHNAKLALECKTIIPDEYSEDFITIQQTKNPTEPEEENEDRSNKKEPRYLVEIDNMDDRQFKSFCMDLLSKNGFTDVEQTPDAENQGIDIIAYKDEVKFGIRCKHYDSNVGNRVVQEAFTGKSYYHCIAAAVLTNSYFTQFAKEVAKINNVILWNREKLCEYVDNAGGEISK